MAYGLKYFSEFADDQEIGYRVEIHERDYSGDSISVKSSGSPIVIETTDQDGIYAPIRTKKATIEWTAEDDNDFEIKDLFIDDDQKYKVFFYEIKEGDELVNYFTGYLVTVDCKEPFQSKPYHVQMSAACGLFFLHDNTFSSDFGEFILNKVSIKDAIGQCLQFSGLDLDFHTFVDIHDIQMGSGDPLALAEANADGLRGVTCYDALSGFLNSLNAFVVQEGDIWVIKGVPELNSITTPRRIYDYQGVFKSADTVNQSVSIGRNPFSVDIPNLIPTENVTSSIAETSSIVKSTISPGIAVNRLENGQFAYPILSGNLRGWDINLDELQTTPGAIEAAGWQRTGSGKVNDPYKFEIRGFVGVKDGKIDTGVFERTHIDISEPIIIDAGLFNRGQKVKVVVGGAYRMRGIGGLYMELRLNENDKDYTSWLDESGKWTSEKKLKNRHGINIQGNISTDKDSLTPADELPVQTFEVTSDPIDDYLERDGHAIAKLYFRIFPAAFFLPKKVDPDNPLDKAPLLVLEDFYISITTETAYEGEHTYVVDADLPIRNANEVDFTSIIGDKINIFTPEQVRLTNRVMTGYLTITNTDNLTHGWRRRIGGNEDAIDGIYYPLQYKILKERLRQLCGKRIVIEGDFLGYDLRASNSVFLQYDDVYDSSKFYTVTGWKWDVINRRYSVKLNELSLLKLDSDQEIVELDKSGSGSRGNRLYGNASGGSSSSGGGSGFESADPIELDPIDPIYFTVNKYGTQIFDLGSYIVSNHLPENLLTKIIVYPTWMNPIYEDRGTDGDVLIYTASGTPKFKGRDQIVIQLTGEEQQIYLAVIPVIIEDAAESKTKIYDTSGTRTLLGAIPGYYFLPDKWDLETQVLGTHNKVILTVVGGGASGNEISFSETRQLAEGVTSNNATYDFFENTDGVTTSVGVFKYSILVYRGTALISTEYGNFTLYDEEYLAKASNELYDTSKNELLGIIDIEGDNTFKLVPSFDVKTIITDLEHDNIHFVLSKDGVEVFTVDYPSDPAVTDAEYLLFNTITTEYGSGKYDLVYTVSLAGDDVYQRNASFEFTEADLLPEAGIDLITFKTNTINYSVIDSLPLFNYQADLPENWGLQIPVPTIDYDYVEWKLYDSTTGGLAEVDVETYTNLPQYISYESGETKKDILVFELKNSLDIDSIHRAPSSFRLKAIFKLGGVSGKVTGIRQADFAFRVPLEPEDYSGTRFLNITGSTIEVIDTNMPKTGTKYLLPSPGTVWSVSAREFNGELFDSVKVKLSKFIDEAYVPLRLLDVDGILTWNSSSGADITETPTDDTAYIIGFLNDDGLRYDFDNTSAQIIIDEIGKYKASFEFSKDSVLIGTKTTEFELIDGSAPPDIPVKDCCGGGGSELPVYPDVTGTWGDEFKIPKITLTENGTISAVEEIDVVIPGDEIVGLVHNFDVAPKIITVGTDLDNAATYGQVLNALASGSADKQPVKTVATSNISLSGLQTINGYTLLSGDRVLVTAQTNATENGCYVAVAGSWTRPADSDTGTELLGATYLVTEGSLTTNQTKWKVTNPPTIVVGATNITIIQVQGAEIDPTVPAWVKAITTAQITNWDAAYTASNNFNTLFDTRLGTKNTNNLAEGSVNKYFTEQRVRDTPLTGLPAFTNVTVNEFDTVLSAFSKFQGQLNGSNANLSNYVRKDIAGIITANHVFTGLDLTLPSNHYRNLSSNLAGTNYFPLGGNGVNNSFAALRVYDASTGGTKQLTFGGDGSFQWNGQNVVLETRQVNTGTGLTGGGNLSANRTLSVVFGSTSGTVSEGNHTHTFASLTSKPTTLAGYGITDAVNTASLNGYVPIARSINVGTGILGGGNLSQDRTISFDVTWGDARYTTTSFVTSQGYITASSVNTLTNKSGLLSMWTNDVGFVNTDTLATTLGNFVHKTIGAVISADHQFTNPNLALPNALYRGLSSNIAATNYFPQGGNGANNSFAALRVYDSSTGGTRTLSFGGDGSFAWNGINVVLATRSITAGTGLSGGGDLSANRTLSVLFGATSGTVSEGNHTHTFASLTSKPTTLAGYGITDAASTVDLSSYVKKDVGQIITADHQFTNPNLALPNAHYRALSSNVAATNYFPQGGNGINNSFASLRVYDSSTGGTKQLNFGGDGSFQWNAQNIATEIYVNNRGFITASSSNNLTNKTGLLSMWTNDVGFVNTDTLATTLNTFVSKVNAGIITAGHVFTSTDLTLSSSLYRNLSSNTAVTNYFPSGGNGSNSSFAALRVYDASTGGTRQLTLGGDGTFQWNGQNIATQTYVTGQGYITASSTNTLTNKSGNISQWTNNSGYITGINASMIQAALGYTPYNASNPNGYISSINSSNVITALGYVPYNNSNPSGYISGITSPMVTGALGYTPIPNNRTITINGNTQNLNDNPNFTITSSGGTLTGSGTSNYISKWNGGTSLTNSRIYDSGSGEILMSASVHVNSLDSAGSIQMNSGISYGTFAANQLYATSRFYLPTGTESAMNSLSSPQNGELFFVTSGTGFGLWTYFSGIGWRIMATRSWVGASNPGSSPP